MKDGLLAEYDHEMATTRRLLERVPQAELAWKPHERSMGLGQLASHIANIPYWASEIVGQPEFDLASDAAKARPPAISVDQVLSEFDSRNTAARSAIAAASDAEMLAPWTLRKGDYVVFTLPRMSALRTFVMNHLIHHRGQLSVYLRLQNIAVPPIYGPTADES
jgi:uncharacterized damage-inducible protein DinB